MLKSGEGRERVLFLTSYYSGIQDFFEGETIEPHGMPAISELWKGLRRQGLVFDHFFFSFNGEEIRCKRRRIAGFPGWFVLFEWRVDSRLKKAFAMWSRLLRCLVAVLHPGRYSVVYVDRAHIIEGAAIALLTSLPVVVRLHGVSCLGAKLRHAGLNPIRWLRRAAYSAPFAHLISSEDGSPVRPFLREFVRDSVPVSIWLNGVPSFSAVVKDANRCTGEQTILYLSRLDHGKGALLFVEAMSLVLQRRENCRGIIVGTGPLWKTCVDRAKEVEGLEMMGSVPHSEVGKFYACATLFVSLSDFANLNNTVLEALQAGCCIVTYGRDEEGYDAATENLLEGAVCFIERGIGPAKLASVFEKLLDSPGLTSSYRCRARAFAREYLRPWPDRIANEIEILNKVIKRRRSRDDDTNALREELRLK